MSNFIRIIDGSAIKKTCPSVKFEAPIELRGGTFDIEYIGAYTYLGGGNSTIVNVGRIGRFCSIAPNVQMGLFQHPIDCLTTHPIVWGGSRQVFSSEEYLEFVTRNKKEIRKCFDKTKKLIEPKVIIGNDVWIGENAFIRNGVNIGDGAIVAARAVVTHDVPPYAIVAGCPAKIIKYRFSEEIISTLLSIKWWNYSLLDLIGFSLSNVSEENLTILASKLMKLSTINRKIHNLTYIKKKFYVNGEVYVP